ncbi:sugar phosphate nucleotidyltransferase [Desulfobacterales bacterium HSG16]|nr:sugar phosphate nucleotidyltransferase [Desulfobacterales bacterium HSG16]
MKAMILAAGFGTRLLPHTRKVPKPLFQIAGRSMLDIHIQKLFNAQSKKIIINTHHLNKQIESFVSSRTWPVPVDISHEPEILGSGGGIRKMASMMDDHGPFIIVNSDILTDIDLNSVIEFHQSHDHPVTLVFYDCKEFNTVCINKDGLVKNFKGRSKLKTFGDHQALTFTGIHIIDSSVLKFIPTNGFSSIIHAYEKMLEQKIGICAYIPPKCQWTDIGEPQRYTRAVLLKMASSLFSKLWPDTKDHSIESTSLKGDGSDRHWYRVFAGEKSLIAADHGIDTSDVKTSSEAHAFFHIGRHLFDQGLPVPEAITYDRFSGLVFVKDLGDTHLQSEIVKAKNDNDEKKIISFYKNVIDILIKFSQKGAKNFDISLAYQTSHYDRELILEKECRYFIEAFVRPILNVNACFKELENEFDVIAKKILQYGIYGLMHRDMQSRNIMVNKNRLYLIDFQGARIGPIQYDLASLLIDPYVDLPSPVQNILLDYCIEQLSKTIRFNIDEFKRGYKYCRLTRNLQMIGAFGFLWHEKGKKEFLQYIPSALSNLKNHIKTLDPESFPKLTDLVMNLNCFVRT